MLKTKLNNYDKSRLEIGKTIFLEELNGKLFKYNPLILENNQNYFFSDEKKSYEVFFKGKYKFESPMDIQYKIEENGDVSINKINDKSGFLQNIESLEGILVDLSLNLVNKSPRILLPTQNINKNRDYFRGKNDGFMLIDPILKFSKNEKMPLLINYKVLEYFKGTIIPKKNTTKLKVN